jgi:hypothetical protein
MVVNRVPVTCGATGKAPPEAHAFSVVDVTCLPAVFAHETGHSAGAGHQVPELGLYPYSHALVSSVNGRAEKCGTAVSAPAGQQYQAIYSSPNATRSKIDPFRAPRFPNRIVPRTGGAADRISDVRWTPAAIRMVEIAILAAPPGATDITDSGPLVPVVAHGKGDVSDRRLTRVRPTVLWNRPVAGFADAVY